MNIVIVDNEQEYRDRISSFVNEFLKDIGEELNIDKLNSATELLGQHRKYDLYLLDVEMPEMDGMELAGKLREEFGMEPSIVFVTSHDSVVFRAFKYDIMGFVRKTFLAEELSETLARFVAKWHRLTRVYEFRTKDGTIFKTEEDIMYAEKEKHDMTIYCIDGEYRIRSTTAELMNLMPSGHFVESHKGYLVNCRYIRRVGDDSLILDNDGIVPLSRRNKDKVKEVYFRYLNNR